MAAKKKLPPPAPAHRGPTLLGLVEDAVSQAISDALSANKIKDAHSRLLTNVALGSQTDHFSDGKEPRHGGLGYAFTMRYGTSIVASGALSLTLPDWKPGLAAELADAELSPSPEEIDEAVRRLDIPKLIEEDITDREWIPSDYRELPSRVQEAFESELDGSVNQSIEAYSEEESKVELGEYPSVYLRWGGAMKKSEVNVVGDGLVYKVTLKSVWDMKPTGWGFDEDVRRNTWHRIAALYTYDRR